MGDAAGPGAWKAAGFKSFNDYLQAQFGASTPPAPEDEIWEGQGRIIDLRDIPAKWPTKDGMVDPAPHAWRWRDNPDVLAAVDAFWRDLLWNAQLEFDGVAWPGRSHRQGVSVLAALRDVARLWNLPSAEETLPTPSRRRANHSARRVE